MSEDRQLTPDTCFLPSFEVDKGPDPALLPLPQNCDRHRRRLKQGAGFLSVWIRSLYSSGIAAAPALGQRACVGAVISFSFPEWFSLGLTLPDDLGLTRLLGFFPPVA